MATTDRTEIIATDAYKEEDHSNRLWRKTREAPFVPIGIGGLLGAVGWGVYKFRHKGDMSTSVYLMHLRVAAQGMVVGAITLGVAAKLIQGMWEKRKSS